MIHETFHSCDLTASDREAWRGLCARAPGSHSPLLGPDFAVRVGRFRPDALVTVWREVDADGAAQVVGFLPHHRRLGGLAHPIGAPFSDYHGPVAAPGFDFEAALGSAGVSAYRFTSLATPSIAPRAPSDDEAGGYLIELKGTAEDYLEALRQLRPKAFKNHRRLGHKIERELGPLRLVAETDQGAFERLLHWKREQLDRTGVYDVLRPTWVRAMLQNLFEDTTPTDGGLMLCLYAGDRLVAGHFGLRAADIYHPWIASTDPELAEWALGHLFLMQAISAMPGLGLRTYDLGPSHGHYKRPWSLSSRPTASGVCFAAGSSATSRAAEEAWRFAGADQPGFTQRLRRRLDTISNTEPTLVGRMQGYAHTVSVAARRIRPAGDGP